MIRMLLSALILWGAATIGVNAQTQSEDEIETRSRAIGETLRCVVCQNQSIEDSNAPLAEDMRTLVRTRVAAGDTDEEVRDYVRARYGDFVLMRPPFQPNTLLLWIGPGLIVLGALVWFVLRTRGSGRDTVARRPLSADDRARLDAALSDQPTDKA